MSNEHYLEISYTAVLLASIMLGWGAFLFLRRQFLAIGRQTHSKLERVLGPLFAAGLIVPAVAGFCSVSYLTCNITSYQAAVASREHLVQTNQAQLAGAMDYIVVAVLIWCVLVLMLLITGARPKATTK